MAARAKYLARTWPAVLLVGIAGAAVGVVYDQWYRAVLVERERQRITALAAPYARSIEAFFDRRVERLGALRAFVEAEPAVSTLRTHFPTFAEGLQSAASGVRAFQLVRNGRIIATWPEYDAEKLVGVDLRKHPDARVREGVQRATRSDSLVITGPVDLLQGGMGFIVRLRVQPEYSDMPNMVAMVLDVTAVLSEAALATIPTGLQYALLDRDGRILGGSAAQHDPTRTTVEIGDGQWTLLVSPTAGWGAAVETDLRPTRAASAMIWLLLVVVTATIAGRQQALRDAVDDRTRDLARANDDLRREVSERLALEEQLLHSQKMEAVGTLAGGVAHDFNNLLTAIIGFTQLSEQVAQGLHDGSSDAGVQNQLRDLRNDLAEILKSAERASLLTSQLLAFSRRQQVMPRRVDLNVVVHDLERMLRRLIGEHVQLVTEVDSGILPVLADQGQLSQVIVNLVVNARDAVPSGGTIRMRTRALDLDTPGEPPLRGLPPGQWVCLEIADDGVGMTPDVMARMFEPFFTTKRLGDGTGLGLSTVYGIVTQASGQLFVESAPGHGTTVFVLLPRIAAADPPAVHVPSPPLTADGELVLVVEDEAGLRRLVSEILQRKGYRVVVAPDGVDALEVLDATRPLPDLVISDVVMPRMGGRELAAAMESRGITVPVLFMSGYQDGQELPDDERHAFLAKPFTPDELTTRVRAVLGAAV